MRLPRFTTSQLLMLMALAALFAGVFTAAMQWRGPLVLVDVDDVAPGESHQQLRRASEFRLFWERFVYVGPIAINARVFPIAGFITGFSLWAAVWGIIRKRDRQSLACNATLSRTSASPLPLKLCWGLMIVGGLVALGIPIVLMFTVGPWLFPTIYFSLFVGLAATARGASRDCIHLQRTAALQLANMIALDPANVVFAAMELALLRSQTVKNYLSQAEQRSGGL
jgi:hypothetical protein